MRIAGIVLGAAGIVTLGVGAFFGAQALSKNSDSKNFCSPQDPNACSTQGLSERQDAKQAATLSTVLIAAGGVALAGGVILWLVAPKGSAGTRVGVGPRGVVLQGGF
jgi:hypothetical protein